MGIGRKIIIQISVNLNFKNKRYLKKSQLGLFYPKIILNLDII